MTRCIKSPIACPVVEYEHQSRSAIKTHSKTREESLLSLIELLSQMFVTRFLPWFALFGFASILSAFQTDFDDELLVLDEDIVALEPKKTDLSTSSSVLNLFSSFFY